MKTLYLDCGMGAAGDMLSAALLELMPDPDSFLRELNGLGIPGVRYVRESDEKCGITGTHLSVRVYGRSEEEHTHSDHEHEHQHRHDYEHHDHHDHTYEHHEHTHTHQAEASGGAGDGSLQYFRRHHRSLHQVERLVRDLHLPGSVEADVLAVYQSIAEAESAVHGVEVEEIHFHEVGSRDAIADVTAVCLLLSRLAPDEIVASPIHVGSGQVECAHGILPVPAPATAHLLKGIPIYSGGIQGELCTPTGAALLRHFVTRFGEMPVMQVNAVGYGMGRKDFERANCVRALWGERPEDVEPLLELSCNVDDMTAEEIAFAMDRLFEGGAREVYTAPINMKKSRLGTLLRVLCLERDRDAMLRLLFRHTSTLGVREAVMRRYTLARSKDTSQTPYGPVRYKTAEGWGTVRRKIEYEDLARIAREQGISIAQARAVVERVLGG